ncbi:hypothetical protein [Ornithinimicrobium kibberense]
MCRRAQLPLLGTYVVTGTGIDRLPVAAGLQDVGDQAQGAA